MYDAIIVGAGPAGFERCAHPRSQSTARAGVRHGSSPECRLARHQRVRQPRRHRSPGVPSHLARAAPQVRRRRAAQHRGARGAVSSRHAFRGRARRWRCCRAKTADRDGRGRQRAGHPRPGICTAAACSIVRTATAGKSAISRSRSTAAAAAASASRSSSPGGAVTSSCARTARPRSKITAVRDSRGRESGCEKSRSIGSTEGWESDADRVPDGVYSAPRAVLHDRADAAVATGRWAGCELNDKGTVRTGPYREHARVRVCTWPGTRRAPCNGWSWRRRKAPRRHSR